MTLITVVLDIASSIIGAKRYGASKTALWGAAIGGVIGIFGGLVGIFLGLLSVPSLANSLSAKTCTAQVKLESSLQYQ